MPALLRLLPILSLILKVGMLVDALRSGASRVWITVIIFAPFGEVIYMFMVALPRRRLQETTVAKRDQFVEGHKIIAFKGGAYARAKGLLASGDFAAARDILEGVVASANEDADALLALGKAYAGLGEYAEAITHMERAIEQDPAVDRHQGLVALAYALTRVDRGEDAFEVLRDLVALAPTGPHRFMLSTQLCTMGRHKEADRELDRLFAAAEGQEETLWFGKARELQRTLDSKRS